MTPEGIIQAQVIDALKLSGCVVWRQNNMPSPLWSFKTGVRVFVGFRDNSAMRGLSDIAAIAPTGRAIQVEVKTPGWKPRNEADRERWRAQAAWLSLCARHGAIAILCSDPAQIFALREEALTVGWDNVASPWKPTDLEERQEHHPRRPRDGQPTTRR